MSAARSPVRVTLYTRGDCPRSDALRARLVAEGARIVEIDLLRSPEAVPELLKLTAGRRVVPVLVRAGQILVAPEGGSEF